MVLAYPLTFGGLGPPIKYMLSHKVYAFDLIVRECVRCTNIQDENIRTGYVGKTIQISMITGLAAVYMMVGMSCQSSFL